VADFLDLIIEGNILTMLDARPQVEAVGVKNGMIASIGDRAEVETLAGRNTRTLALDDRTIIPGFIETHMHMEKVHTAGFQISIHTCGTRATEKALNIYQKILSRHPRRDHRHRIEHFEMPLGDQIRRAVDLKLALAMQPMFLFLSGEATYANICSLLGSKRAGRWKPFRSILDAGGLIAAGSDGPVTKMSPLKGIQACILHPNERQRITRYEALKMFTVNAARIGFEEHLKGSIEPGKLADFTVLSDNPYSVEPEEVGNIKVEMTIVGGSIVYEA